MEGAKKMSEPLHHLRVLHNNPFIFASAFTAFFQSLGEKERGFLFAYLVLPMTLYQPSREFLQKANKRSSIRTMLKERKRIYGLDERINRYREMTNTTIQYLQDAGNITVGDQLTVSVTEQQSLDNPSPEGVVKAAQRLALLFRPYDVPTVFRMLGVMSL
jgi:hypothetical protein